MGPTILSRFFRRGPRVGSASTSVKRRNECVRPAASSNAGGSRTEREGFEPSVGFYPYTRLAGVHLRPLGHLSGAESRHLARLPSLTTTRALVVPCRPTRKR